ncbi:MAG: hypothetical protein Ta2G_14500 [Termitinemataceae bacterium]|nr:MAG: hypothetical protein Ta2G_14500 [Termitinemataceae bacterium]
MKLWFYFAIGVVFLSLKLWYYAAETQSLFFMLKPLDLAIYLTCGAQSVYSQESGFYYDELSILIDKSCSGFNFLLICFLLFSYLAKLHCINTWQKIIAIPCALLIAYLVTIFTNFSRIMIILKIEASMIETHLETLFGKRTHEAEGVFVYLFFLIALYLALDFCFKKVKKN